MRHTRAIQRAHSKRVMAAPPAESVEQWLRGLIQPAVYTQIDVFRALGLRARILTLPVMMAFVVSLIWRQIGSVGEAVRALNQEGLLWVNPPPVSEAAVLQRLNSLPAVLFENVFKAVLPMMAARWGARSRPLPEAVAFVQARFSQVLALDGSTLDGLLRKIGLLRETPVTPLAGRIAALLDVVTRLPRQVWYAQDAQAHDQRF